MVVRNEAFSTDRIAVGLFRAAGTIDASILLLPSWTLELESRPQ